MKTTRIIMTILLAAVITFCLRALPFLAFQGERKMPAKLKCLGEMLPSSIMAVLIVYCFKDVASDMAGVGIPKFLALAVVFASYKWKHNVFLSIVAGTGAYMILVNLV